MKVVQPKPLPPFGSEVPCPWVSCTETYPRYKTCFRITGKAGWMVKGEIIPFLMGVYVLKEAIEKAGSLDPEAVVAALEHTDLMGVYGRIRFDSRSHQVIPALDPKEGTVGTIFQWQQGKRVAVYPLSSATGEVHLPSGLNKL